MTLLSSVTERWMQYLFGTTPDFCEWCQRPLERSWADRWTSTPECTGEAVEGCVLLAWDMREDPPEPDYGPEDPAPVDLWVCNCLAGEVLVSVDWETGAPVTELCTRCDGTGVIPPL